MQYPAIPDRHRGVWSPWQPTARAVPSRRTFHSISDPTAASAYKLGGQQRQVNPRSPGPRSLVHVLLTPSRPSWPSSSPALPFSLLFQPSGPPPHSQHDSRSRHSAPLRYPRSSLSPSSRVLATVIHQRRSIGAAARTATQIKDSNPLHQVETVPMSSSVSHWQSMTLCRLVKSGHSALTGYVGFDPSLDTVIVGHQGTTPSVLFVLYFDAS